MRRLSSASHLALVQSFLMRAPHAAATAIPAKPLRASGDVAGNSHLTALTAIPLLILLAAEGLTLLSLQAYVKWHVIIGMLIVPLVGLKLGSTGYRFLRYYTGRT